MAYTTQVMIAVAAVTVPFIATIVGAQAYVWIKGAENV